MLNREVVISQIQKLGGFAEDNLTQLDKRLPTDNEIQDFYLGYLRRQSIFAIDMQSIFKSNLNNNFVSQFILSRCIIDDYLHLVYIVNQPDPNEEIICFNADAHEKNFKKLAELAKVNEEILGGNFPNYPTTNSLNVLKLALQNNPKKAHYFLNAADFKFKTFKSTGKFIADFPKDQFGAQVRRAYYLWRHLSDYVHYSKLSFDLEFYPELQASNLNIIQEVIYYSYRVIKLSFRYFESNLGLSLLDKHSLLMDYKLTEEEESTRI